MDSEILHCFKLVEANGRYQLEHFEITDWSLRKLYSGFEYSFKGNLIESSYRNETVKDSKLDRFVNNKVFTFNPEEDHAKMIIEYELNSKKQKAEEKLKRCSEMLNLWNIFTSEDNNGK